MRRRDFIGVIAGSAAAWPLAARTGQGSRIYRLGVLIINAESDRQGQDKVKALLQELSNLGWRVGENLQIDYRWGISQPQVAQTSITELLSLNPDIILANSVAAALAAQRATSTIPIVFTGISEPAMMGLVKSVPRPGGNITGFSNLEPGVGAKWLELLKTIAPQVHLIGFLFNPDSTPAAPLFFHSIETASRTFAVQSTMLPVHQTSDIEKVISNFAQQPEVGLIGPPDTFLTYHLQLIADLTTSLRIPMTYPFDYFTTMGGLLSYGPDLIEQFRQAAHYIDRILKGEKPADLPVQEPTKFRLVINLKTAKALDLKVSPTLLATADEVIE